MARPKLSAERQRQLEALALNVRDYLREMDNTIAPDAVLRHAYRGRMRARMAELFPSTSGTTDDPEGGTR